MISYQIYKLTHFFGLFLVLTAIGGMAFAAAQNNLANHRWRKFGAIAHGVGLFLVLLGGFGMLARLGLATEMPGWVYAKLGLWTVFGGMLFVLKRRQTLAWTVCSTSVILAVLSGYLALYKPF